MEPQSEIKEGPQARQDYFTIDTPDTDLVRMIDKKLANARPENKKREVEGNRNEKYWGEDQLKGIPLRWYNSKIVQNRIYLGVETIVPIMTANPPAPVVTAATDKDKSKELAKRLEQTLLDKYDTDNQQLLFQMISRHWLLYKIGTLKIRYDDKIDDFVVEFVHPNKIIFGDKGYFNTDVWIAEYLEHTVKELIELYPEREDDIMANFAPGVSASEVVLGTPVGHFEYWCEDGSFTVDKYNDVILQKKLNPYLSWNNKEFAKDNHFRSPKKPYMFMNSQNLGRHIWDDTTPVSQVIRIQDGINLLHRIITDTAADQGILIGAQDYILMDELYKYTGGPLEKLSVKGSDATKALFRLPPKQLQSYAMEMLLHLEDAADNIMGTHSTTRGERSKQPTLGQDVLAKESDYGRIDGAVRGLEKVADELFNWETQVMKLKYKKAHYISRLGDSDASVMEEFKGEDIEDGIKITVKQGSTLPTDKLSQRQEAIELAKLNKIDPITFFERMSYPNPRETAKRLVMYNIDPKLLFPELVDEIEKINKQNAKEIGRLNGKGQITPELSVAANNVPPPVISPEAIPPTTTPQVAQPTEHTQRLLAGEMVPPFDGVEPSDTHLQAELTYMGSSEFLQNPEEIQAVYADHVIKEKRQLESLQPQI